VRTGATVDNNQRYRRQQPNRCHERCCGNWRYNQPVLYLQWRQRLYWRGRDNTRDERAGTLVSVASSMTRRPRKTLVSQTLSPWSATVFVDSVVWCSGTVLPDWQRGCLPLQRYHLCQRCVWI